MLKGHDVIYIAGHDFNLTDSRISTDHIAQELAADNRILYVESVGLRAPRLDGNDLARIGRKLLRFFRPPRRVDASFWVMTPLAIPWHHVPLVRRLNRLFLIAQIRLAALLLGFRRPVLIVFLPHMEGLVGRLREALSVYYCTDEHAAFPGVDTASVRRAEEALLRKVDLAFATAPEILKNKQHLNANFFYSPHGVDFDNFTRAFDEELPEPTDVAHLPHPVIGYFGAIDRWLDLELIHMLATARPEWSFVLIGKQVIDTSMLAALPNVHLLGQRPFGELPAYGSRFDVAIIPFMLNELTVSVSPIKLKEYLAMGKPVVSTPLPAVVDFAAAHGLVEIASKPEEFLERIEHALANDSRELALRRREAVRDDTWQARARDVGQRISEFLPEHLRSCKALDRDK